MNLSLKKHIGIVETVLIATVLFLGLNAAAQAADLTSDQPAVLLAVPGSYTYADDSFDSPGSFVDSYAFTITPAGFNTVATTISFDSFLGISNLSAALFSGIGTSGTVLVDWSAPVADMFGIVTFGSASIDTLALDAGTYSLGIRGDVIGSAGGSYSGTMNLTTPIPSPIPEPGSGLMLLIGLALVGFQLCRNMES